MIDPAIEPQLCTLGHSAQVLLARCGDERYNLRLHYEILQSSPPLIKECQERGWLDPEPGWWFSELGQQAIMLASLMHPIEMKGRDAYGEYLRGWYSEERHPRREQQATRSAVPCWWFWRRLL